MATLSVPAPAACFPRGPRRAIAAAVLTAIFAPGPAGARAAEPAAQDLEARIDALEAQVRQLREQQAAVRRKQEEGRTVEAVRVEAERQSRVLDPENLSAGYTMGRGFVLESADHRFLVHPFLFSQFRNVTNYRDAAAVAGAAGTSGAAARPDTETGFELRRLKFGFDGNAVTPDLTYQAILSADRKTGNLLLEDAWARYHLPDTPLAIRAGQIRNPLDHEQLVFAVFTLTAERSLVDDLFANVDSLVKGVSVGYDDGGALRAEAAVTGGMRTANTNFQQFPNSAADWGAAARVEWKVAGEWKDYRDFTARGDERSLLVLGAGADYTEAGRTGQFTHVVDAQYEDPCGLSLYAAYLGRYVRHNAGPPGGNGGNANPSAPSADTYDATFRAQAGYVIGGRWEPFVRYEFIRFAGAELPAGAAGRTAVHEVTAGVTYYFAGHRAKVTADVTYLPDGCPVSDDASGVLATRGGGEVLLRAQFQLWL